MSASEPLPRPPAGTPAPSDGTRSGPSSAAAAGATASAGASAGTPPPARRSGPAPLEVDPITLEVVCEGLIAIVREMRATIIRSSFSSVIYEFDDFSCALFGSGGEMVAQSWDHPGHVLPLPWGVRCMFEDFTDDLHPGDVVLLNDPYRGGTHLNDVTLIHPIFDEDGNILVFPAVRAHWVDVGGMVPGSYSGLSTNIYQEGVRIPPIKILERGRVNRAAMALLMANMRVPEEREGDFNASLGACQVRKTKGIMALVALPYSAIGPAGYERPSPTRARVHRGRGASRCGSRPCTAGSETVLVRPHSSPADRRNAARCSHRPRPPPSPG